MFNGQGNGNPNAEFSPDVTAVAICTSGGTAYVAWGFRSGEVGVTSAPKVMDQAKSGSRRHARCALRDVHGARVEHLVFAHDGQTFVSGGFDGAVKLWSTKGLRVLWMQLNGTERDPEPVQDLAYHSDSGSVAAALRSGPVLLWTGLVTPTDNSVTTSVRHRHSLSIPSMATSSNASVPPVVKISLHASPSDLNIVVHCEKDKYFHRVSVNRAVLVTQEGTAQPNLPYTRTRYGDGPLSSLTTIKTVLAMDKLITHVIAPPAPVTSPLGLLAASLPEPVDRKESSFVVGGDELGRVCIWDWDAATCVSADGSIEVSSSKRLEAHNNGAVCAIEVSPLVLVTGR